MSGRAGDEPSDAEVDERFNELVDRFYSPAHDDGRGRSGDSASLPPSAAPPSHGRDWLIGHPLFDGYLDQSDPVGAHDLDDLDDPDPLVDPLPVAHDDRFGPHPTGPVPRLSNPALAGALLVLVSVMICLLAILGLPFPAWCGGLAVLGFVIGVGLLLSRLPPQDDDSDDGAVL